MAGVFSPPENFVVSTVFYRVGPALLVVLAFSRLFHTALNIFQNYQVLLYSSGMDAETFTLTRNARAM